MKMWKRNAVVAAIVLFVCAAVYLNWSYQQNGALLTSGKTLGEAALVDGTSESALLAEDPSEDAAAAASDADAAGTDETAGADASGASAAGSDYYDTARLNREQSRSSALSLLQEAANSEDATQEVIDSANTSIQTMAADEVAETDIENLILSKGYADCIAYIGDSSVSVVVSTPSGSLTAADTAKITDIVTSETDFAADQIKIIEAD